MNHSLKIGLKHHKTYKVPATKMVPNLYPESAEFVQMPKVFATGFLVGLLEWACIEAINPHIDFPKIQTLGIDINASHQKATLEGGIIEIDVELTDIQNKKLFFNVVAYENGQVVSKGTHQRYLIDKAEFDKRIQS